MYIISILAVIIISRLLTTGNTGGWLFDYLTITVMLLFDFTLLAGTGLLKDFNNAFRLSIRRRNGKESLSELRRSIEAVRLTRKVTLASGMFFLFFEAAQILMKVNWDEVASGSSGTDLGGMLATGLSAPLYAAAIILILLPMESILRLRLWDMQEKRE